MMQKKAPLISVILPVYNSEKYIGETIESILNQTFRDFELIIIDDASTDSSSQIIREYVKKDNRIRAFYNKKNLHVSKTTNLAISYARAEFLANMDGDDIAMPTRLEKQYEFLTQNSDITVVGSDIQLINEKGDNLRIRKYPTKDIDLKKKIFRYSPFCNPVVMYRKSALEDVGGYPVKWPLSNDLALWFLLGIKYKFANIPEVLFKYRFFSNSNSNSKLRKVEINTIKIRWNAWRALGYQPNFLDIAYNLIQGLTIYIMPIQFRMTLFDIVRKYF